MPTPGDLREYLDYCRLRNLRPDTLRLYTSVLTRVLTITGRTELGEVTEDDLAGWERSALRGRAPETRRGYVSAVQTYYRWAARRGLADPSTHLAMPQVHRGLPRPIGEDDLDLALKAAHATDLRLYAMLRLMADAGLRAGEVAGVWAGDLRDDTDPMTLTVRYGKGGRQRTVPVGQSVRVALLGLHVRRGWCFPAHTAAGHMSGNHVSHLVNRHLHKLGIPATGHQLRHRMLTVGYQHTRDIRLIQSIAGHQSPATTAVYTAWAPANATGLVAHLDGIADAAA